MVKILFSASVIARIKPVRGEFRSRGEALALDEHSNYYPNNPLPLGMSLCLWTTQDSHSEISLSKVKLALKK